MARVPKQFQGCFTTCLPVGEATSSEPALAAVNLSRAAEILFTGFRAAAIVNFGVFNSSGEVARAAPTGTSCPMGSSQPGFL